MFDHPWLRGLADDPDLRALMSPEADLARMLRVEAAWAQALGEAGVVAAAIGNRAAFAIRRAAVAPADLCAGTARDGVPVPALVAALREGLEDEVRPALHRGLTSQDVVDTARAMMLVDVAEVLAARLAALAADLMDLGAAHAATRLTGRTRMQAALPIPAGHRIAAWAEPLQRHADRLDAVATDVCVATLGGAVGLRAGPGAAEWDAGAGQTVAEICAAALKLDLPARDGHAVRDGAVALGQWAALVAGSTGKIGQDIALMAQMGEVRIAGAGASSAMPNKRNPVAAEVLVALARYAAGQSGTLAQAMVAEQERSGAAWTLEWLVLPDLLRTAGAALLLARRAVGQIEEMGPGVGPAPEPGGLGDQSPNGSGS